MSTAPRKLSSTLECPVDNFFYLLVAPLAILFRRLGLTANEISILGLVSGLLSIYFLYHNKLYPFVTFYILSYIFDLVDGYFARKYDQVTVLGDYLDHIRDLVINFVIFILLFSKMYCSKSYLEMGILAVFFLFTLQYLGMQEIHSGSEDSPTLSWMKLLAFNCNKGDCPPLKYYRFFGNGTFILVVCILACLLHNKKCLIPPIIAIPGHYSSHSTKKII
jgi:phosphatidylglycerophosphate synthase